MVYNILRSTAKGSSGVFYHVLFSRLVCLLYGRQPSQLHFDATASMTVLQCRFPRSVFISN